MVYLSGAGLPRLSWKKAVKRMYVCVCSFSALTLLVEQQGIRPVKKLSGGMLGFAGMVMYLG